MRCEEKNVGTKLRRPFYVQRLLALPIITYTDTKKLKAENPDIAVEDVLIEVTTTNNGMFCRDVIGGYTFDKYIGILKLHNLLKEA